MTLGNLATLQSLYLSNNLLTGTIPHQLGSKYLSLREIFLHGNSLTGTLPEALADLPNLNVLFIDDNKLTGAVPAELCARNLNEVFFHDTNGGTAIENVDSTFSDLYGKDRITDPTNERDGCTSIACPTGYKSQGDNNKDGVFPCELCDAASSLNPYIGSNTCFALDQDTIIASLYDATNGPSSWTGAKNWGDSSVATCDKDGVTCNDAKHVMSIVLTNMGLSGSLPAGLGFLSRLVEFDVSNNDIRGMLPADLRFAPLEILDVAENQLTGFVPIGLCQKAGVNGNGLDGLYTCDTISCRAGTHSSIGRADPGTSGGTCRLCTSDTAPYLGIIGCTNDFTYTSGSITPFGLAGEIVIAIFGITMLCVVAFIWRRSDVSAAYIIDRAYYQNGPEAHQQQQQQQQQQQSNNTDDDETFDNEMDPLAGIDGIGRSGGAIQIEIKVKDEWTEDKETKQEVWLDVPKIA